MKPHFPSQILRLFFITVLLAVLAGAALPVPKTYGASITVNSTTDAVDANPGNGVCATAGDVCTLRAAVQEANALAGDDTIVLPAGTYTLTIAGQGEDSAATGDLDITSGALTIIGAGAGSTIVEGGTSQALGVDRVFHITGAFTVNISGVTIRNGRGPGNGQGGGIYNMGRLTVTNSTFSGNGVDGYGFGAGISNAGTLTVTNSTFSGNQASEGPGINNGANATLTITGSTFSNNGGAYGGGIAIDSLGTVAITSSTFSSNTVTIWGGGISNGATLTVTNSTFSGNKAGSGGGIYNSGTTTLRNTIVANSTGGGDCAIGGGTVSNGGNNIVEDNTCGFTGGSDPNLGSLADNGGPTQTHALQSPSPAINTANPAYCPTTDQRGYSRPDTCDIGSYEYNGSPTAVTFSSFTARTDADGNVLVVPGLALTGVIGVLAAGAMWWLRRARRA